MRVPLQKIQPLLAENRVFLMGKGVSSAETTGAGYREDAQISIAPGLELEPYTTFWGSSGRSLVTMGAFSYTHTALDPTISVGRYTSLAAGLKVMGRKHPHEWASTSPVFYNRQLMMRTYEADRAADMSYRSFADRPGPISVGNDVWIGENVTLGHDVRIGDGAVIASNAVVTKDVQPYAVVGGVPARTLRDRFSHTVIADLLRLRWWRYAPEDLSDLDVRGPDRFCGLLARRIENGDIRPFAPRKLTTEDFERLL